MTMKALVFLFAGVCINSARARTLNPRIENVARRQAVHFEPNQGQVAGPTQWIARSGGVSMYITGQEVVYALAPAMTLEAPAKPLYTHNLHMRLVGANPQIKFEGVEPLGSYSNYFIGQTEKDWFTGIPHFAKVRYNDVYPGIDMVYYADARNVEYDFIVHPGGDANDIELAFSEPVELDHGDLIVAGLRQRRPKVMQNGREIAAEYRITHGGHVRLTLAQHDDSRELIIDPVLEFSTYLGGPGEDSGYGVAVDRNGFVYLAGGTQSPVPPGLNPFQQSNIVGLAPFVFKFTSDGKQVVYHTYLSSNGWDVANAIAIDGNGSPIITGSTRSASFPLKNPIQAQFKAIWDNAFLAKLSPDGRALVYSTYWGGNNKDWGTSVTVDAQGSATFSGNAESNDFRVQNAVQPTFAGNQDCFITRLTGSGVLVFSTFFGGSSGETCGGSAIDSQGDVVIVGESTSPDLPLKNAYQRTVAPSIWQTPFLVKFAPDGSIVFSTFFGGAAAGWVYAVAVDPAGNIYAAGNTRNPSVFVLTPDAFQSSAVGPASGFFVKFDPGGQKLLYASLFGGSGPDAITGIAVDGSGSIYLSGLAEASPDFPVRNSFQPFYGGGILNSDMFVAKFAPDAKTLIYSTLMGGHNNEEPGYRNIAVDANGSVYCIGKTISADFPVKNAYQTVFGGGSDIVFFKISDATALPSSPLTPLPGRLTFVSTQGAQPPSSQTVKVSGGAFSTSVNAPWINASGAGSSATIAVSPSSLSPGNYTGTVILTPPSGSPATVDVSLTVFASPAMLTSIDPPLVAIGSSDSTITIHGSGFASNAVLQVNGVPWTTTRVQSIDSGTLKFSMPANYFSGAYNHTIAVQNSQAALSNVLSVAVGTPAPVFTAASVVNAGSFAPGPVAPGEIVTIFGTDLTGAVTFSDIPATIVYSSPTQVSATVPYLIGGQTTVVKVGSSAPVTLSVAPSAPGIFAAVSNGDGTLTLYATGCGQLTQDALPVCQLPVTATINGEPAQVLYAGAAPGLVQGANQINVLVPSDIASGPISIVLTAGTASSKTFSYTLP